MTDRRDARPPPIRPGSDPARPFPRSLLAGPTLDAGRALLGALLVRQATAATQDVAAHDRRVGRIVEVEAYVGEEDQASHARFGPTGRNRVMYGRPGTAYVYLVYGMHHCLNVVTEPEGRPAALLVRAVEPVEGIESMRAARAALARPPRPGAAPARTVPDARLAAGPGLVAAAFGITRADTGLDMCDPSSPLRLESASPDAPPPDVVATPRIGIDYAREPWVSVPWRLTVAGSPSLSGRAGRRTGR